MLPYLFLFILAALPVAAQEDGPAFFEKNVRPILASRCLSCHSATSQPIMGGLRLDAREQAVKGGGRGVAIVPGKPDESLLIKAVDYSGGISEMPPDAKLPATAIADLREWIRQGALLPQDSGPTASLCMKGANAHRLRSDVGR